jgi:hypothetical protein
MIGGPAERLNRVACSETRHRVLKSEPESRLPVRDIVRALWRYTMDPEMRGERRVPMRAIADLAGVDVQVVSAIRRGDRSKYGAQALAKVGNVIASIENGEVRFRRRGQVWQPEFRRPPAVRPPPQDKLTRATDHREWARCRTCQGDSWKAIVMHGAAWVACAQCVPKSQWLAIGAAGA